MLFFSKSEQFTSDIINCLMILKSHPVEMDLVFHNLVHFLIAFFSSFLFGFSPGICHSLCNVSLSCSSVASAKVLNLRWWYMYLKYKENCFKFFLVYIGFGIFIKFKVMYSNYYLLHRLFSWCTWSLDFHNSSLIFFQCHLLEETNMWIFHRF